jgi:hypothetical protein
MKINPSLFRKINMIAFNGLWYLIWALACFKISGVQLVLGLSVVALYSLWHLMMTPLGQKERFFVAVVLALSFFWEVVWGFFGIVSYGKDHFPFWIVAMWVNFALSLSHSWWPLIRSPISGVLLGLAAGFIPYYAGEKLGIVRVEHREILLISWVIHATIITKLLRMSLGDVKSSKMKQL